MIKINNIITNLCINCVGNYRINCLKKNNNTLYYLIFITVSIFFMICQAFSSIVTVEQGKLAGIKLNSRNGSPFWAYFGIPYARPPIGKLRFQPPQPPRSWAGVRDASKTTVKCIQWDRLLEGNEIQGQEDCLYLNVFTPNPDENANIPVMFCIHSGAFMSGSSVECFPSYFMDKKIVMVSIDYRLGLFGFLSTADESSQGNYGLKDQVAGLQWVKKNIKKFGGNPNMVTILGQSAGGASVHYHMLSPLSQGLFHRAISQSGSALAPWAIISQELAKERAIALGLISGCPIHSTKFMIACLQQINSVELMGTYPKFYVWNGIPGTIFTVSVEPDNNDAFISEHPWWAKELSTVPWLLGITSGEGGIIAADYLSSGGHSVIEFNKNFQRYAPMLFKFIYTSHYENVTKIADSIKEYYFGNYDIGFLTGIQLRDMVTDGIIAYASIKSALRYNNTRYFYYYDHLNEHSFNEIWGKTHFLRYLGVSHGDDMLSLYPMWMFPPLNPIDFQVSTRMIEYWTNFAYNGDPNGDDNYSSIWKPLQSDRFEYLHIQTASDIMESRLLEDRYHFWNTLPLMTSVTSKRQQLAPKSIDISLHEYKEISNTRYADEL